ncbi:MAG TPA: carbamoyltransferase C-terminal domain-containing protein [Micromonosporaceae bacterium]|nr:carbamoyltransferase C-terminal domain-containing protein [Micromonosporaceae bacterium]
MTARVSPITAGLSLSWRGSVALVRDDRLLVNVEFGKLRDGLHTDPANPADPFDLEIVPRVLAGEGYDVEDVDEWVVDGWCAGPASRLPVRDRGGVTDLTVAGPASFERLPDPGRPGHAGKFELGGWARPYTSYPHVAGHLAAAYCTSAFARRRDPCVVLVWDERCAPHLYRVGPDGRVQPGGVVPLPAGPVTAELFVDRAVRQIRAGHADSPVNLCCTGDRALDAGWSSALLAHPMVREIWVPPFPDGSGSAIGAAAVHLCRRQGLRGLEWRLESGPELVRHPHVPDGWSVAPCRPEELARLLHRTGAAAVVLNGRAKLGPRALGSRSILAPATDPEMRVRLNRATRRDDGRPIGALCLSEHAPEIFDPGTADPYQTFVHRVRPEWVPRIPAVVGADGTTRLQTVGPGDDAALATILREYHKWRGVPVLCSTDVVAGAGGSVADVQTALRESEIDMVWSDGVLNRRIAGGLARPRAEDQPRAEGRMSLR